MNETASHVHSHYAQAQRRLAGISLWQAFKQADELATVFSNVSNGYPEDTDALHTVELINSFRHAVDIFAQTHTTQDSVPVLQQAARLRDRLAATRAAQAALIEKLEPDPVGEDFDTIAVTLDGDYDLDEFLAVLQAIKELCDKLTEIFEKFGVDPHFAIRRIESGSIFFELFAIKIGIAVLRRLFTDGADFVSKNFTAEGVMKTQIPLHTEALQKVVKLRGSMKKDGIPTDALDEALGEEAAYLVKRIHTVTSGKPLQFDGYRLSTRTEPRRIAGHHNAMQIRHEPTLDLPPPPAHLDLPPPDSRE